MNKNKHLGFVGLMVALPLLPYVHIFFKDNVVLWNYISKSKFLKVHVSFYESLGNFTYYPLLFSSISLLFYLLYKSSSSWLKAFLLFPMYFAYSKLIASLLPIFYSNYWYSYYLILFIPFASVFYKKLKFLFKNRSGKYKNSFFEIISIILLICVPFSYELNRLFTDNIEVIQILFIKIHTYGFNSASEALLAILQKICFLIPFCIYFFVQKKWIKYAVLFPILIYSAQLINILNPDLTKLDETEIFQTLPYTIPLLFMLFLLGKINENQEKIEFWLKNQHKKVEASIRIKFSKREVFINKKRHEIAKPTLTTKDLEQIKSELEKELKAKTN